MKVCAFVCLCLCAHACVNVFFVCMYVSVCCFVFLCFGVWCELKYVWIFVCLCL